MSLSVDLNSFKVTKLNKENYTCLYRYTQEYKELEETIESNIVVLEYKKHTLYIQIDPFKLYLDTAPEKYNPIPPSEDLVWSA